MALIHAEVIEAVDDYLEEWADAVGCEKHEVAGTAIESYLSEQGKVNLQQNAVIDDD